jgi:hypothetical protein
MRLVLFLLLATSISPVCYGQKFKDLKELGIVVEDLDADATNAGLTRDNLDSQTLVAIKRDIPKLKISETANSYLYIRVTTIADKTGCAINFFISLNRLVNVVGDGGSETGPTRAAVWDKGILLTGACGHMPSKLHEVINDEVTLFAAEYYKENP